MIFPLRSRKRAASMAIPFAWELVFWVPAIFAPLR